MSNVLNIFELKLKDFFATVEPGDQDWSWKSQFEWLEENHAQEVAELAEHLAANGQERAVVIGPDGRLWDGHHRVLAAYKLGHDHIVVKYVESETAEA